jgi:two-component system, OmpR family, KDP operon response regulator KdpE
VSTAVSTNLGVTEDTVSGKRKANILLIEDDPAIRRMLSIAFQDSGLVAIEAGTGQDGIKAVAKNQPDLILLDIGLPDMSGLDVVESVRSWSKVPIIILSANGQEHLKVECLECGADDYVTKPFGVAELMARIRVVLRRESHAHAAAETPVFESGSLKVDMATREVFKGGKRVKLTPLEYKLLITLIKHAGRIVTHRQLLAEVWGPDYTEESQYLRLYIGYLRKKLEDGASFILNEPGVGYRLILSEPTTN